MAKLVVEVLDAGDLLPTDDHGTASPFVEVDFDGRRRRTQTKTRDLYPSWNEKLVFDIENPRNLHNSIIEVTLYDDRCANRHKNFLGCVQISGASVPLTESEAAVQRHPLCKRGAFSHGRGDISLKIYAVRARYYQNPPRRQNLKSKNKPKLQEINDDDGKQYNSGVAIPASRAERGSNSIKAGTADDIHLVQRLPPDHALVEPRPSLTGQTGSSVGDKTTATSNDLVEQMPYLFVKVVKARDLPFTGTTGDLDPYVEIKFRDYKGVTKHMVKNESPVWDEVFAFCKDGLEPCLVEAVVKDFGTDEFVGRIVVFDPFPLRVQADSPLTPQWYELENQEGDKVRGEIMLAVWMGTQADDAFPGAWQSDSHSISAHQNLANTRSNVYFSPTLYYLRVHVIEAQDLAPFDENQPPKLFVHVQLGHQNRWTFNAWIRDGNPFWSQDFMLVVSEPLDDFVVINVIHAIRTGKEELIGRTFLPVSGIPKRFDSTEVRQAQWFNLNQISSFQGGRRKKQGKILLRLCLEAGYHIADSLHGDFQPTAQHLRKDTIGNLELTILSARDLPPMKQKDGGTTDAYCLVKYGNKWVRTRTILNSQEACWNEQYAWEVYDPCTVIMIGIFDNCHVNGSKKDTKDVRIGKVRIPIQTLEMNRIHKHNYTLLVLFPSGLRNFGELQVAVRFTGVAWANMVAQYTKPVLPKMHYLKPLSIKQLDMIEQQVSQMVAARLSKVEPSLQKEVIEYMLDAGTHMWSLRRQKADFHRLMSAVLGATAVCRWFDEIRHWRNPLKTIFVHVVYLVFVWYPKLILPTFFLSLSMMGLWNYRFRPRNPPQIDARLSQAVAIDPDLLDEEFDTFPTSQPVNIVRVRYARLRSVAGRYQTVFGDIATQGEKAMAMLSFRDGRASSIFTMIAFVCFVLHCMASFRVMVTLLGLYWLRHPRFRSKMPSVLVNLFKRLPSRTEQLL